MTEIKRFDMRGNTWPSDDGSIVSYKDHAAIVASLQEQVRALAAENAKLRDWLISDTCCEIDETAFPSTDAVLREIRAQGVEALRGSISDIDNGIENTIDLHHYCTDFAARIRAGEQP